MPKKNYGKNSNNLDKLTKIELSMVDKHHSMKIKGKHILVVVGGYGEKNNALFSVELLDPSSDKGWVKGKQLFEINFVVVVIF